MVIVEIGGTVGDIESLPFLEAVRQFRQDVGRDNAIFVHLALVPYIATAHELKTKPMQHSVRELRAIGIQPDILLCRTDRYLSPDIKSKLALYCDVPEEAVITAKDVDTIYEVPLVLSGEGLDAIVLKRLGLEGGKPDMAAWEQLVRRIHDPKGEVVIGIVGKYVPSRTRTRASTRPCPTAVRQRRAGGAPLIESGAGGRHRGEAGRRRRHPGPRRLGAGTAGMVAAADSRASGASRTSASATASGGGHQYARNVCGLGSASARPGGPDTEHKVITSCRTCSAWRSWAGRCAWAPTCASCGPARARRPSTARPRSGSATATATSSTRPTRAA